MENEKAKYIENAEKTLLKDLEKSSKKLHQVSNWYGSGSSYKTTSEDIENAKIMIKNLNNMYFDLRSLLSSMKEHELGINLKEITTIKTISNIEEIDEVVKSINEKENKLEE